MTRTQIIEHRKAVLRARGVPERFIDALATRKRYDGWSLSLGIIAALLLPAMIVTSHLDVSIDALVFPYIYPHSPGRDALIYAPDGITFFAYTCCFLVMGLLFLIIGLRTASTREGRAPAWSAEASRLRTLRPPETLDSLKPSARYAALEHCADDRAFLVALGKIHKAHLWWRFVTLFGPVMILVTAVSMVYVAFDTGFNFRVVRADAIEMHHAFQTRTYPLATAKAAYVTCYSDRDADFEYRVVFPQRTVALWLNDPDQGDTITRRLGVLDAHLTALHVPIYRMPATGSPGFDGSACVRDLTSELKLKHPENLSALVFGR